MLVKLLWGGLTGTTAIILAFTSSWAASIATHTSQLEQRANLAEQHFVAIQHDIQDLRERMVELKELVKEGR